LLLHLRALFTLACKWMIKLKSLSLCRDVNPLTHVTCSVDVGLQVEDKVEIYAVAEIQTLSLTSLKIVYLIT